MGEYQPIHNLKLNKCLPGAKLLLQNTHEAMTNGMLLLKPKHFVRIAGRMEQLAATYELKQNQSARKQFLKTLEEGEEPPPPLIDFKHLQRQTQVKKTHQNFPSLGSKRSQDQNQGQSKQVQTNHDGD